ncbi:CDP-alcohol phosphatidyltransferase family protein [Sphingomicrobium astaxanthinifaciens]|uniref:CDP-alcohol phosphatidyltransferase family protein n=1 Tax=Sphingomicrobium astaxanthinifaciens TaxID=1227949 RepID=UPI001FCA8CB2|nr:CDP-alcohol phosphatidyltransferase family protein [Sphingomicrobium astaxanthinifaciens]MCJ7421454.1 hypothetical protein [Sphingomicrobium astaxanthinifaciens]
MSGFFPEANERPMLFVPLGDGAIAPFGLAPRMRAYRVAAMMGLEAASEEALREDGARPVMIQHAGHAVSPGWIDYMRLRPGTLLCHEGVAVLAHASRPAERIEAQRLIGGEGGEPSVLTLVHAEDVDLEAIDQRHRPFIARLDADADCTAIERALYGAATPRVSDAISLTLLRPIGFALTRAAARAGLTANRVTGIAALFALLAFAAFWQGWFGAGLVAALLFALADTIDGKLAKITGTSNLWGRRLDAALDLLHPPLWYIGWMRGLERGERFLEPVYALLLLATIVAAYAAIRGSEILFARAHGFALHLWKPFDSRFHLIAARRNINILLLAVSAILFRPEWGIQWVAFWSLVTAMVLGTRLAAAKSAALRGDPVTSWLLPVADESDEGA